MIALLPFKNNCSQLAGICKKLVTVFAICSHTSTETELCSKTRPLHSYLSKNDNETNN